MEEKTAERVNELDNMKGRIEALIDGQEMKSLSQGTALHSYLHLTKVRTYCFSERMFLFENLGDKQHLSCQIYCLK